MTTRRAWGETPGVRRAPTPDVSVVIPTFERSESLKRLLHSLADSDLGGLDMEVLVVDDGSADATPDVLAAAPLPVVQLRQMNSGPAVARNRGWRAASGPLVLFLDDDVVVTPDAVRRLVATASSADAVGARIEPLGNPGIIAGFMHVEGLSDHKVVGGEVRYLVTAGAMFSRRVLEEVGGFDEAFPGAAGEDADLSFRLIGAGRSIAVEPNALVLHEYRSTLPKLARTYYRHGSVQPLLRDRHAARKYHLRGSARDRLAPKAWAATYRRYRTDASVSRSSAYIILRAAMMVPWISGAVMALRSGTRTTEMR